MYTAAIRLSQISPSGPPRDLHALPRQICGGRRRPTLDATCIVTCARNV